MKIGITFDLRKDYLALGLSEEESAEFDSEDTVDSLDGALRELGYQTDRIGSLRSLVGRLASGERWDLVFNICEGLYGLGRESQVPAILEAYQIPFVFSDAVTLAVCHHKAITKMVVRSHAIATPEFITVESLADMEHCNLPFPLFVKPVAEGTSKGITPFSVVNTPQELHNRCAALLEKYRQPVLVESFLSGREFTVGILGTGEKAKVVGSLEVQLNANSEQGVYSFEHKEFCERMVTYRLAHDDEAQAAAALALKVWQALGCRDGGRVDVRYDKKANGYPYFIEANPLAGLNPTHSDLPIMASQAGMAYQELIREIVDSAKSRYGLPC